MTTPTGNCNCGHPRDHHERQRAEGKPARVLGCCSLCDCQRFEAEKESKRAKMPDELAGPALRRYFEREYNALTMKLAALAEVLGIRRRCKNCGHDL